MSDPITLNDIKQAAAALNGRGLATLEDLRLWISKDVDKGIPLLSATAETSESLLMALLIAEFCDDAGRSGKPKLSRYWRGLKTFPSVVKLSMSECAQRWREKKFGVLSEIGNAFWHVVRQLFTRHARLWHNWRRHWADALLIVVLPVLLVSLLLRVGTARNNMIQSVTVKKSATLGAFQRIGDEVEVSNLPYTHGGFTAVDQVRGRYTLVPLAEGATLLDKQILSTDLSNKIQGRRIFSISLKAGTYVRDIALPRDTVLILSPRESAGNQTPQIIFDVVLLSVDKNGEMTTATVAIQNNDFEKAAALLGSHDAYLSQIGY